MKIKLAIALFAVFALSTVLTSALAEADGKVHGRDFILTERTTESPEIDLPPAGLSPGDRAAFYNTLYDESNTEQVGTDGGECVIVKVGAENEGDILHCVVSARLPAGSLTAQGLVNFNDESTTFAITGGTEKYRNARGQVTLTGSEEEASKLHFELK